MTAPIRVVVVDDHQILRDGRVALLGALDDVTVLGTAGDGREAIHVIEADPPAVVVMDIQMPVLDGIEATRHITGRHPDVRVLMLTMNEDDGAGQSRTRTSSLSGSRSRGSRSRSMVSASRSSSRPDLPTAVTVLTK